MKTLAAIREADEPWIGEKAARLSRLVRAGLPVPETLVLDSRDVERFQNGVPPPDLAAGISRCAGAFRARGYANLIIRRSPLRAITGKEEKAEAVFDVPVSDFGAILSALAKCSAISAPRPGREPRKGRPARRPGSAALLIQAMLPREISGTVSTLDPAGDSDTIHLIADDRAPSSPVRYDWFTAESRPTGTPGASFSPARIAELSRLALDAQREFGFPLRMEWIVRGEKIFIVEVSPLTNLAWGFTDEWATIDSFGSAFAFSGTDPYSQLHVQKTIDRALVDYFSARGTPSPGDAAVWTRRFAGETYWNLSAMKREMKRIPGFVEREFDEGMGLLPAFAGSGDTTSRSPRSFFAGLRFVSSLKRSLRNRPEATSVIGATADAILTELDATKNPAISDDALAARATRLAEVNATFTAGLIHHFVDLIGCRILFLAALNRHDRRFGRKSDVNALLSGLGADPRPAAVRAREISSQARAGIRGRNLLYVLDQYRGLLAPLDSLRTRGKSLNEALRVVAIEMGRRLVARGAVTHPEDVLWLEFSDIAALFREGKTDALLARLARNRAYAESYRNFSPPRSIRKSAPAGLSVTPRIRIAPPVTGIGVSPGTAEGEVHWVASPDEVRDLNSETILAAHSIEPGTLSGLMRAKGIIAETGGPHSPGALFAREYGLPAIFGIPREKLPSGTRVRLDGTSGAFSILPSTPKVVIARTEARHEPRAPRA